jgi:hypothetical protein
MTGFGKRGSETLPKQEAEDDMNVSDRFVLSSKFPTYMTMGLIGGVLLITTSGIFKNGLPSIGGMLGMILPLTFLTVVIYFSFRGMQKQHANNRATRKQLAKYPQLYFWGFAGGASAYALHSGTSLTTLWADLKASFVTQTFSSTSGSDGFKANTFMDMGHWILGGVLLAYVATLVLDKVKERQT